jgi:hypothetical protein
MWSRANSIKYPELAEYFEKIVPEDVNLPTTLGPAISFRFRVYTDAKGFTYPIPGLRTNRNITYKIEVKDDLPFKAGDKVKFDKNDRNKFTIQNIEYSYENEAEYSTRNATWPGLAGNKIKTKILTLE